MKKSSIVGKDFNKEFTRRRMLGIEVIVRKGLKIRITRSADTFED